MEIEKCPQRLVEHSKCIRGQKGSVKVCNQVWNGGWGECNELFNTVEVGGLLILGDLVIGNFLKVIGAFAISDNCGG